MKAAPFLTLVAARWWRLRSQALAQKAGRTYRMGCLYPAIIAMYLLT